MNLYNKLRKWLGQQEEVTKTDFDLILEKLAMYNVVNPNESFIKAIYNVTGSQYHTSIVGLTDETLHRALDAKITEYLAEEKIKLD